MSSSLMVSYWVLHTWLYEEAFTVHSQLMRIGIFHILIKKNLKTTEKSYLNPWKVQGGQRRIYTCHFDGKTELLIDDTKNDKGLELF